MSTVLERESHQYYSPERKAEVLAMVDANGGNVLRTSQDTGIHHSTIQYWQANAERFANLKQQTLGNLETTMDKTVHRLINSIYDHDLDNATLAAKATAFGVVFDKLQLLRGLPTLIAENLDPVEITVVLSSALDDCIDVTPAQPLVLDQPTDR